MSYMTFFPPFVDIFCIFEVEIGLNFAALQVFTTSYFPASCFLRNADLKKNPRFFIAMNKRLFFLEDANVIIFGFKKQ